MQNTQEHPNGQEQPAGDVVPLAQQIDDPDRYSAITCIDLKSFMIGFWSVFIDKCISKITRRERRFEFRDWVVVEMEDASYPVRTGQPSSSRLKIIGDDELDEWD